MEGWGLRGLWGLGCVERYSPMGPYSIYLGPNATV